MNFKQNLYRHLINIPGWHTTRKIVVIESDDWGSIRMPSLDVYKYLLKKGIRVDNLSYNRYDSLASQEDLSALFEVLSKIKDNNGIPAIITANTIVGNPDFEKIRQSDFQVYHFEPFTETLKRYPRHSQSFNLWKDGIRSNIFRPQFHGREHLNVNRWMRALQNDIGNTRLAFDLGMFDLSTGTKVTEDSFMEAMNFESLDELDFQKKSIQEGLHLFENIFGYKSITFIAPCYRWSDELNAVLKESGIRAFQGGWFQLVPIQGNEHKFIRRFHYTGQKNKLGQSFLVRNAQFEPSYDPYFDWIEDILNRANIIFRMGKPLIISSHRVNYIGSIDEKNRKYNLTLLKKMFNSLLTKWPEIEFMSSDQLTNLILKK